MGSSGSTAAPAMPPRKISPERIEKALGMFREADEKDIDVLFEEAYTQLARIGYNECNLFVGHLSPPDNKCLSDTLNEVGIEIVSSDQFDRTWRLQRTSRIVRMINFAKV